MSTTDRLSTLSPYAERLLDDYIYDQLDDAASRLNAAYRRISGRPAKDSLEDKWVRRQLAAAAQSLRNAGMAATGRKPPKPTRRPPRAVVVVGVAALVTAIAARRRKRNAERDYTEFAPEHDGAEAAPVDPGRERIPT